jgi:hypothetical protein
MAHKEAVAVTNAQKSHAPINEVMSKAVKTAKQQNQQMLVHVITALKHLSRQNLPPRGKYKECAIDQQHFNLEPDSNLNQVK